MSNETKMVIDTSNSVNAVTEVNKYFNNRPKDSPTRVKFSFNVDNDLLNIYEEKGEVCFVGERIDRVVG